MIDKNKVRNLNLSEDELNKLVPVSTKDLIDVLFVTSRVLVLFETYKNFLPNDILEDSNLINTMISLNDLAMSELQHFVMTDETEIN
tara:strand:- start:716 stop:976 length:261 start_codon:yes stop_codon:yes gene_type:complete